MHCDTYELPLPSSLTFLRKQIYRGAAHLEVGRFGTTSSKLSQVTFCLLSTFWYLNEFPACIPSLNAPRKKSFIWMNTFPFRSFRFISSTLHAKQHLAGSSYKSKRRVPQTPRTIPLSLHEVPTSLLATILPGICKRWPYITQVSGSSHRWRFFHIPESTSVFSVTQSENSCLTTKNFYCTLCKKGYWVLPTFVRNRQLNTWALSAFMCLEWREKANEGSHCQMCLFAPWIWTTLFSVS